MNRREKLEDAFFAYNRGAAMSDEQLKIAYETTAEMVETMFAMRLSGAPVLGFVMQEQSLRSYLDERKRNARTSA